MAPQTTRVETPDAARLAAAVQRSGIEVRRSGGETLFVNGYTAREVGVIAARHGVTIHELTTERASLEEAFMHITRNAVEYSSHEGVAA